MCNLSPNTIKHQLLSLHKEQPSTKQPCHSPSANILYSSQWKLATLHEQLAEKAISSHCVILGKTEAAADTISIWLKSVCYQPLVAPGTVLSRCCLFVFFYRGRNLFWPSVHPKPLLSSQHAPMSRPEPLSVVYFQHAGTCLDLYKSLDWFPSTGVEAGFILERVHSEHVYD